VEKAKFSTGKFEASHGLKRFCQSPSRRRGEFSLPRNEIISQRTTSLFCTPGHYQILLPALSPSPPFLPDRSSNASYTRIPEIIVRLLEGDTQFAVPLHSPHFPLSAWSIGTARGKKRKIFTAKKSRSRARARDSSLYTLPAYPEPSPSPFRRFPFLAFLFRRISRAPTILLAFLRGSDDHVPT